MKVVCDTNVYVSAFFWGGVPGEILKKAARGEIDLFSSEYILNLK
jgi:predicted nucleic acid-binding protein